MAIDISILKTELSIGHPDTGVYNSDDKIAADQLNAINRKLNKVSMTGSEILNAIDPSEWNSRTDTQKQLVWNVVHLGTVNPFGVEATLIIEAFNGAGGITVAALAIARKTDVSRAVEVGLGVVKVGYVEQARHVEGGGA